MLLFRRCCRCGFGRTEIERFFRCNLVEALTIRQLAALACLVERETRTSRNQTADDHVFLQTAQIVALAHYGRFGQHARRFLERSCRDERIGRERCLRNTEQHVLVGRGDLVFRGHPVVLVQHVRTLNLFAHDEARIAVVDDLHTTQHLTHDHFNVLVVDLHALQTVHVLHFVHDVTRQRLDTLQTQDVMRISRTVDNPFALVYDLTVMHQYLLFLRDQELMLFAVHVGDHQTLLALRVLTKRSRTRHFRQNAGIFRGTRFEQFSHARQTTGNVTRLLRFNRDTRQHFTDLHLLPVLPGYQCADLEADLHRMLGVRYLDFFALRIEQLHLRTNALRRLRTATLHVDHDER